MFWALANGQGDWEWVTGMCLGSAKGSQGCSRDMGAPVCREEAAQNQPPLLQGCLAGPCGQPPSVPPAASFSPRTTTYTTCTA